MLGFLLAGQASVPSPAWAGELPRVTANGELLEGLWEGSDGKIAAFKGVPFATPPIGDLRWKAAISPQPRKGLQSAKTFAPACMQGDYSTKWYLRLARSFQPDIDLLVKPGSISEDCLYLNVWSPDTDADADLPVIVWVYGFSNKGGWSYEPNYNGVKLAERGVVLVTIAYRVGPLGYFSHPLLDNGPGEAVANFGWTDVGQAFAWINKNIRSFGGDPGNITAAGESSGAGNISDWLVARVAEEPLFRRVIIQSNAQALSSRRTLAEEQAVGERLINSLGLDSGELTLEKMRQIPARQLLEAAERELGDHYFDVVVDDLTFKQRPLDVYDTATISGLEILIGSNQDEWYMYLDEATTWENVDEWLAENAPKSAHVLRSLVADESEPRRALERLVSARVFHCPSRYISERVAATGGHAWMYSFTRKREGIGGKALGAYHGAEIPYLFGTHDDWLPTSPVDRALTDAVMDYWVQFARTGNPNMTGRPEWPRYQLAKPRVMELGDRVGSMSPRDADLCLWLSPDRQGSHGGK